MSQTDATTPSADTPVEALRRTLGMVGVLALSLGAMIGSGIFVLPGLAFTITGPSVMLAYLIAGIAVLPAVFSKAEMATAMPSAGGTYLYIDRAMGPMMGTIAGFGVWFALTFKAAFALVGLGAYLSLFADVNSRLVGLAIAIVLVALNLVGVNQSTALQIALVAVAVAVLIGFVLVGAPNVDADAFDPFLASGTKELFSAAAVVFVSYAGVTKIASIAEEVRNPERTIPRSMFLSIGLVILLYPAVVGIMVGVTPASELAATTTPAALAAEQFAGDAGRVIVGSVAVVALISMGNAGIVAAARYPFAMSRNQLAPAFLHRVGGSSAAPTGAIIATGLVLTVLVAFVPLLELAKLASAFQLLVFAFVNLAVIAFRESRLDWYRPTFRPKAYPYVQIFGIVVSLALLTQIGLVSSIGALVFVVAGVLWYRSFGQARASRESAARDAMRNRTQDRLVEDTATALGGPGFRHVVVALGRPARFRRHQNLMRLAMHLVTAQSHLHVLHFDDKIEVPSASDMAAAARRGIEITMTHHEDSERREVVRLYAEQNTVDLVLSDLPQELSATRHIVRDWRWLRDHLPNDSAFLRNRHLDAIDRIVVLGTGGPYDPLKLSLASRIAKGEAASLRLIHVAQGSASAGQIALIEDYHSRLIDTLNVPAESLVEAADELVPTLTRMSRGANLVILGAPSHRFHLVADFADHVAEAVDCPALLVHTPVHEQMSWRRRMIERFIS